MKKQNELSDIANREIAISMETMTQLLTTPNPTDCIPLYIFYYQKIEWRKVPPSKCPTNYAARCLKISEERVRKTKKILRKLNLIEIINTPNKNREIK